MFGGKSKKKNRLLKSIASLAILGGMYTMAFSECTHDFLMNASFDDVDDVGAPFAWSVPNSNANMGYEVNDGVLKMWVKEGGNATKGEGGIQISQTLLSANQLVGQTVYARAWVKHTAVDEATVEDLACIGEVNEQAPEPNNTKCHTGLQLLVQQSYSLPGPPWFGWKEWNAWYDNDGSAKPEWTKVEGSFVIRGDVTKYFMRVFIRSQNSCTLWVDNIQMSTEQDFCGEEFISPDGTVDVKHAQIDAKQSKALSMQDNRVNFRKPANYTVRIIAPNGKQLVKTTGYGKGVAISKNDLAPGFYIVNVTSDLGNMSKSIVVQNAK